MLTPWDKWQTRVNDILQVEITRKCDLFTCSNCTRLLPFRKDTLEMSLDVFERALESLEGWPGVVAVFGGNPCTHSQFRDICRILTRHVPPERRGLWTNHTRQWGELCRDTFSLGRLNLNAHGDRAAYVEMEQWFPGRVIRGTDRKMSWHAAILVDWKDMGVAPEDWIRARESCDINRKWSAIIQERDRLPVAYFCEVAGAIDGVTGERNGLPVYPGWWKDVMEVYAGQVARCCDRGCAIPLRLQGHLDMTAIYDVSRSWLPLASHGGPSARRVTLQTHETRPEACRETTDYVRFRT